MDIFQSKTVWKILEMFFRKPWVHAHARGIIKMSGTGPNATLRTLQNLVDEKVLNTEKIGNMNVYALNGKNELARKLLMLYHERKLQELPKEFRNHISRLREKVDYKNVVSLVLFGSVAKGEQHAMSDIDILVIYRGSKPEKLDIFFKDVFRNYSRDVQTILYAEKEFNDYYRQGHALVINMLKDGIIIYDDGYFYNFLFNPIPKPAKNYLEDMIKKAEKDFEHYLETEKLLTSKKLTRNFMEGMLYIILNNLAMALLMLRRHIPESRKNVIDVLKKMKEDKLASWLEKTKKAWDEYPIEVTEKQKTEVNEVIRETITKCYAELENYE